MRRRSTHHEALGAALSEERKRKGISQEELSHLSGLHRTYVGGVERGERNPTLGALVKLASALGVKPSYLLARAEALIRPAGDAGGSCPPGR